MNASYRIKHEQAISIQWPGGFPFLLRGSPKISVDSSVYTPDGHCKAKVAHSDELQMYVNLHFKKYENHVTGIDPL